MKKLYLLILCLLITGPVGAPCSFNQASALSPAIQAVISAGGTAAKSCPGSETSLFSTIDQTDDYGAGINLSTRIFIGQGAFAPATDLGGTAQVCAVSISVRSLAASSFDLRIEIYEMSGVNLGAAPTGTCVSNTKTITGAGVVKFDGLNCTLDTSKTYGIAMVRPAHDYDAVNFMTFFIDSAGSTSGGFWSWDADKARSDDNTTELVMQIWGYNP